MGRAPQDALPISTHTMEASLADLPPEPALLGIKLAHVLAGAAGGIVRSFMNPGTSLRVTVATCVVGALVAGYGTPIGARYLSHYLDWPDLPVFSVEGLTGFLLGMIGLSLCEALIRRARSWKDGLPPLPPGAPK